MKKIIFVRHGESTQNKEYRDNKSYDKNNIKLTDEGKKQAMITGKYLYKIFGKFDKVYSSPAIRCVETANIIMDEIHHKKKVNIDELLVEIGDKSNITEGLSKDEIEIKKKELEQEDRRLKLEEDRSERINKLLQKYLDDKIDSETFERLLK